MKKLIGLLILATCFASCGSDVTPVNLSTPDSGNKFVATPSNGSSGLLQKRAIVNADLLFLQALSTGIVKNTTTTGVLSIATGADLPTMSSTVGGAVPTPPNDVTKYLDGTGAFSTPAGGGSGNSNYKEACNRATTANLVGTYSNGSSGVGATLIITATGVLSIDGANSVLNDRVLIKNQTTTFQNGIYTVTTAGAIGIAEILTRATDFDQSADITAGDAVYILSGTANSATTWAYSGIDSPTMGTTAITFAQIAGQGSFTAGNGISISGTSIAVDSTVTLTTTNTVTSSNKTLTAPVLNSPVINTTISGTGVDSGTGAGSTLVLRDSNANFSTNNIGLFSSNLTSSATTTTLTSASPHYYFITGTNASQIMKLPANSSVAKSISYTIVNNNTSGSVLVNASDSTEVAILNPGHGATFANNNISSNTNTSWTTSNRFVSTATVGDIYYANGTDQLKSLAIGTTGQVLMVVAGVPSWQTLTTGFGLTDASTVAWNMQGGLFSNGDVTLAGNRTLGAPTNIPTGGSGVLVITQDGTGSRTLAYNSVWKFQGGTAPTLTTTAGAKDVLAWYSPDGTNLYANLTKDYK